MITKLLTLQGRKAVPFDSPVHVYSQVKLLFTAVFLLIVSMGKAQTIGGVNLGNLTNYLFVFTDGSTDANWQAASKGFIGDVAINGNSAEERTSGSFAYAGKIYTNASSLNAWQDIVDNNNGQATAHYNQTSRIEGLVANLESCFSQINALTATSGYSSVSATSLNSLNTQNSTPEVYVINVTSGFSISSKIYITGDANDVFFLRWDSDANFANGYNGQVKFQSGGGIVPQGGLKACNFIHVAGDINASGGGLNPSSPFPQGPRYNDGTGNLISGGKDFSGGGFFTGYWLTTGSPTLNPGSGKQPYGETSSLSNGIFVGGWYSKTTKFSMTSGTSGVYVAVQTALPVTWLDVKAEQKTDREIAISWSTSTEINNAFFEIEKTKDNRNYTTIGNVAGAGNKSSVSHYQFIDFEPSNEVVYYRIKQVDYDGKFDYSKIVTVKRDNKLDELGVYPNPAVAQINIEFKRSLKTTGMYTVSNSFGQIVKQGDIASNLDGYSLKVDDLGPGLYYFDLNEGSSHQHKEFMIVR